jgi:AsmA protein
MKKIAIALAVLLILGGLGLVLLARSVLTGDHVRAAVAAQLQSALGQPVTIGGLEASIYPRVTMVLTEIGIGTPATIQLQRAHVGTDLWALLSRRIERAAVQVSGARIELPLPPLALSATGSAANGASASESPIDIVSVDEIVLTDVTVLSGGRSVQAMIELLPRESGIELRRVALAADETTVDVSGTLETLTPLTGHLEARAPEVNFDRLLAFFSDFAATPAPSSAPVGGSAAGRLVVDLTLGRATTGALALADVRATATVNQLEDVTLSPLTFGVFNGRYDGTMHLTLGEPTRFRWQGHVSGIDTGAVMAFAGTPNTITGTLAGTVALDGTGLEMERALRTSRGTARVDIADGSIAGLALVRTIVLATSGRGGYGTSAQTAVLSQGTSGEAERFSRLGATLALADGVIRTNDLAMQSTDVDLTGAGTLALTTMAADVAGQVRLSDELSKKGGTDLYRYAQQDGRVTLPVTVSGPLGGLSVRIDLAQAASRALQNRAKEELDKAIERNLPRGIRGLFPKKPPG